MASPAPSDSSVSSCDPPTMRFSNLYLVKMSWSTYEYFCRQSINVGDVCESMVYCFLKSIICTALDIGTTYWTNCYTHLCDEGMFIFVTFAGPFLTKAPVNGPERLQNLIHNALRDIGTVRPLDEEQIVQIKVSKIISAYQRQTE